MSSRDFLSALIFSKKTLQYEKMMLVVRVELKNFRTSLLWMTLQKDVSNSFNIIITFLQKMGLRNNLYYKLMPESIKNTQLLLNPHLRKNNILYIKIVSKILSCFFWWLFLHHLGMREAEQRITFCCFLSLIADKYSIDARKNRFLFFF